MTTTICIASKFLSTLSLRRATALVRVKRLAGIISIHALLAESDDGHEVGCFLIVHFYPRSPCGERRGVHADGVELIVISIHALLAESDCWLCRRHLQHEFLSTLSLRRATNVRIAHNPGPCYFYPRSPCGERPKSVSPTPTQANFYPRSPCGERRPWKRAQALTCTFLSTLSLRRATVFCR